MKRRATLAAVLVISAGAALGGCSSGPAGPELKARDAYLPQPAMADMAGGYLAVDNTGDTGDELTAVTSDISDDVQLHRVDGTAMKRVDSLKIPANGGLELTRGGSHLMLMNLEHKPTRGEKVSLKLHFATHEPITLEAPVEAINHNPQQ